MNTTDNQKFKFALFADDKILIITTQNYSNFTKGTHIEFININIQLKTNSSLNLERTTLTQFLTTNSSRIAISFGSDYNIQSNIINTKFLR
jgi:hypothetical protein